MTKHVEIENINGFILRGYLELPENAKRIVVMLHGFTGNKTNELLLFRRELKNTAEYVWDKKT